MGVTHDTGGGVTRDTGGVLRVRQGRGGGQVEPGSPLPPVGFAFWGGLQQAPRLQVCERSKDGRPAAAGVRLQRGHGDPPPIGPPPAVGSENRPYRPGAAPHRGPVNPLGVHPPANLWGLHVGKE